MSWTRSGYAWREDRTYVAPPRPSTPDLTVTPGTPEAGRLYGPRGNLISVVHYPDSRRPFGFQGNPR